MGAVIHGLEEAKLLLLGWLGEVLDRHAEESASRLLHALVSKHIGPLEERLVALVEVVLVGGAILAVHLLLVWFGVLNVHFQIN